jgi:phenylalanyl-tRNA synthetase beta chain
VAPDTRDVVIEAAHFTPAGILRMSRRHGLVSESSLRFERGVDPELPPYASAKAAMMLVELGGGVYGGVSEVDFPRERPAVTLRAALPGEVVGVPYDRDTVVRRLTDVGCEVVGAGADTLTVTSPTWRTDLLEPYDLVEEVARLEGYDAIPAVLPVAAPGRGWTEEQRRRQAVSRALAAAGYVEVLTVPFHSRGVLDALAVPVGDPRRQLARLANPLSEEAAYLRTTLLPGLVEALRRNLGRGSQDVLLYELGTVFRQGAERPAAPRPPVTNRPDPEQWAALEAALPEQPWHAAAILAGHAALPGWWGAGRVADWSDAVQAGRTLAAAAGVPVEVHQAEMAPWHPGRCAAFTIGGQVVGYAGELHPKVVDALDLPRRTCALEIDLSAVLAVPRELASTPLVSPFPVATQDVALVVDSATPAAAVEAALRDGAGELLESLRLFDVYAGPQLGEGRKSLAYTLRFRAADRTLTAEEATAARDAAVAEATARTGATLRA